MCDGFAEHVVDVVSEVGDFVVSLPFPPSGTVREIKCCIQRARSLPFFKQELKHGDNVLDDVCTLAALPPPWVLTLVELPSCAREGSRLLEAARLGNRELAERALRARADVDHAGAGAGRTPLYLASRHGHLDMVRFLRGAGANINKTTLAGASPAWAAAHFGHLRLLRYLSSARADLGRVTQEGASPIIAASQKGHADVVQFLCTLGVNQEARMKGGWAALTLGSLHGRVDVVRVLCEARAHVEPTTQEGVTPLLAAAQNGHLEVARILLERGANKERTRRDGSTPLMVAAHSGHAPLVRYFCAAGVCLDTSAQQGVTPLFVAAQNGHAHVVQILCEMSADINLVNVKGATPLCVAAQMGHVEVVMSLLVAKADKDRPTHAGVTALLVAAQNGHLTAVRLLCEAGADKDREMQQGATPLYVAAQNGHLDVVRYLCEAGAAANKARVDGATPLVIASHNGHTAVVRYFRDLEAAERAQRCMRQRCGILQAVPTCSRLARCCFLAAERLRCPRFWRRLGVSRWCFWPCRKRRRGERSHIAPAPRAAVDERAEPLLRPEPQQVLDGVMIDVSNLSSHGACSMLRLASSDDAGPATTSRVSQIGDAALAEMDPPGPQIFPLTPSAPTAKDVLQPRAAQTAPGDAPHCSSAIVVGRPAVTVAHGSEVAVTEMAVDAHGVCRGPGDRSAKVDFETAAILGDGIRASSPDKVSWRRGRWRTTTSAVSGRCC
mmetsp:Transcript_128078/g.370719  ORF Transcript_128078/g.370719 Transcript_128078/m.370719 type:complete len:725 (-) Transcript_128078:233-2407(-)